MGSGINLGTALEMGSSGSTGIKSVANMVEMEFAMLRSNFYLPTGICYNLGQGFKFNKIGKDINLNQM